MRGTVKIGEHEIEMSCNAATPIRFQQVFGKNLLTYFVNSDKVAPEDSTMAMQELAYIMTRSAEGTDMNVLSYEDYLHWLEDYDPLDFLNAETTEQIINLYLANSKTASKAKKGQGRPTEK